MRIFATILLFAHATLGFAQEATPEVTQTVSANPPLSSDADDSASTAGDSQAAKPENPFLQSDLELMVANVQRPNGIVWFDDSLYTVCNGDWTIYKIDDRTGDTITFVFGVRNGANLIAEATETGFDLWIPDPDTGMLWMVDQRRLSPVSIRADLPAPWGITRLNDDRFLVTDTRANSIVSVSIAGELSTVHSELRAPTGIVQDDEIVYFANGGSARKGLEYFELTEDEGYTEVKPLVSGLQNTTNVALGADGYLYFAYALGTRGVVGRIEPTKCLANGCSNQDVEMVVFSDIPAPLAIALSDDLRLFLHSRYRPEIYWVQLPA